MRYVSHLACTICGTTFSACAAQFPDDPPGGCLSESRTGARNRAVCHLIIHPPPGGV
jgi:hypothetical protein